VAETKRVSRRERPAFVAEGGRFTRLVGVDEADAEEDAARVSGPLCFLGGWGQRGKRDEFGETLYKSDTV